MRIKSILAGALGAIVALGCAHAPKQKEGESVADRQPVYVESVRAPSTVKAGEPLELTIEGNLPTPAWRVDDVQVERSGQTVTVTVWARLVDKGVSIQVLEPITQKVTVPDLPAGQWTVRVKGHGDTEDTVQVKVE